MYFIKCFNYEAVLNERYKTVLSIPYLQFQHCTIFQTVCMNNIVDKITFFTADIVTAIAWVFISVLSVTPQVIFKGGYFISTMLYHCFGDLDSCLVANNFTREIPTLPVY